MRRIENCPIQNAPRLGQKGQLPSGKHTKSYGKSPSLSSVNQLFLWAIFNSYVTNYQRVHMMFHDVFNDFVRSITKLCTKFFLSQRPTSYQQGWA